ncbi:Karyopherin transporter [Glugoides intestinalis]
MTVLNIAEKPSVAKSISRLLSTNCNSTRGMHKYCANIHLEANFNSKKTKMIFTSVLGHLFEFSFKAQGKWTESDPKDLFRAPILKSINPEHKLVAENIKKLCTTASHVIIWTDCDREGENIARQIKTIVEPFSRACIKRARFSAISRQEIEYAMENLVDINFLEADAVDTRIELDLRIGSAFTRIQTISYDHGNVVSFGPCQIPTLNFVVQKHRQIESFISEKFFSLENTINKKNVKTVFKWERGSIFDKNCVIHFYNELEGAKAVIVDKKTSNKEKYKPLPLRTVEFQKVCSSYYKIDGHKLMEIAEKLYNSGYISYPRTETDAYPKNFGFSTIINKLKRDPKFGEYAENLKFSNPRTGNNNDQAHSPIYPLRDGSELQGDERKVFEFISRRFLGCISENARGVETEYKMKIDLKEGRGEIFQSKGLIITERNYLDVYIYEKWEMKEVGEFRVDEVVENNVVLTEGKTTVPEYLTESDLIGLMDKHGIGTDATIHEHIHKIQVRGYARKEKFRFIPERLGINLIRAYKEIGLPISEPDLRKRLEEDLKKICENRKEKEEVLEEEIKKYTEIYESFERNIRVYKEIMEGGDIRAGDGSKTGENTKSRTSKSEETENVFNRENRGKEKVTNINEIGKKTKGQKCDCEEEVKVLEARTGSSIGRKFKTCHYFPKRCSYFEWEDEDSPQTERGKETIEDICNCFCGYEAQKKVANTESNKGREFYSCKKSYKKCKFFKWAEE